MLLNFEAVASLGLAALFLGETVAPLQLLGGLGVLSGAILTALAPSRRAQVAGAD